MITRFLTAMILLMETVNDAAGGTVAATTETGEQIAAWIKAEVAKLSEALQTAITEGHVSPARGEVVITTKASPTGKGAQQFYLVLDALDARGQAVLCNGKLEPATRKPEGEDSRTDAQKATGACDYFNYGFDLDVRSKVRAKLMGTLEGPEKAIKKAIDSLVANAGFTEEMAREIVIKQRTAAGLAV